MSVAAAKRNGLQITIESIYYDLVGEGGKMETILSHSRCRITACVVAFHSAVASHRRAIINDADQMVLIFPIYFSITSRMLLEQRPACCVCVCVLFFFFGKHNELAVEFIVSARTREKA